jgi:TrmH family RNA methyltransferase
MNRRPLAIQSPANPRVKAVVKLRQRSHRGELGLMIIEGCREIERAVANRHVPSELFVCRELFAGTQEPELVERCRQAGAEILECAPEVFRKMAYRERPEGLLAIAPQVRHKLDELTFPDPALLVIAEAVEKPGNLGTILRSADAAGAHAVIVCDRCTDINNPNVVRASLGTLFTVPVVEAATADTLAWLQRKGIRIVAATPHADALYTAADLTQPVAIVLGTEQRGLSPAWLERADIRLRIPMLGQVDSLNVAAAAALLLYEAVRQRSQGQSPRTVQKP